MHEKPLGILLKCRSASEGRGWDLRVYISSKLPLMPILLPRVCGWGSPAPSQAGTSRFREGLGWW